MSIGGGQQESSGSMESRPTTPEELQAYFNMIDQTSGGRLGTWATQGTSPTHYNQLTQSELQAIGGAGATRHSSLDQGYADQMDQISTDSSMTYAQRNQASQQATDSYNQQADAINKEVEAAMTGLASQENQRLYSAELANNQQLAQDLALLAQIFYGGKGQYSTQNQNTSQWDARLGII